MPMPVGLNHGSTTDLVCGQVSVSKAVGIDANQMPSIKDFSLRLWRMADDHAFAAFVAGWQRLGQVRPVSQYVSDWSNISTSGS